MKFTIIIPCHNESKVVAKKIKNTFELGNRLKEIIIVDDNSTDATYATAKQISKIDSRIIVIKNKHQPGKNFAIRTALPFSSADIICMTDADILLPSNALEKVCSYFNQNNVGMVCLSPKLILKNQCQQKKYVQVYEKLIRTMKILESRVDSVTAPHGQALFFRKDLNLMPLLQADDVDMAIQTRKKGYKVKYIKDCFFAETLVNNFDKLKKQKIRRCKAVIDALLSHKDVFLNPKYRLFGLFCYPLNILVYVLAPFIFFAWIIFTIVLLILTKQYLFALIGIVCIALLLLFTRFKSIIALSEINFLAIKEYLKIGSKNSWETPREINQKN